MARKNAVDRIRHAGRMLQTLDLAGILLLTIFLNLAVTEGFDKPEIEGSTITVKQPVASEKLARPQRKSTGLGMSADVRLSSSMFLSVIVFRYG